MRWRRALMRGQGIVACLVGLSALGCGDGPMTPADELTGRVVFASSRLNTSAAFVNEVFVMNADGSNQTRLTYTLDTLSVASPTWSPDGLEIAFAAGGGSGSPDLFLMNADGSNLRRIFTAERGIALHTPRWSPDGTRIAFTAYGTDTLGDDVYVLDLRDGSLSALTEPVQTSARAPTWSPDGSRIAFGAFGSVYIMQADGSAITEIAAENAWELAWSPDGNRLAYMKNSDIFVMNVDGTEVVNVTAHTAEDYSPTWSPDGAWLAFTSDRSGRFQLWAVRPDGSGIVRLTETDAGGDRTPDWTR